MNNAEFQDIIKKAINAYDSKNYQAMNHAAKDLEALIIKLDPRFNESKRKSVDKHLGYLIDTIQEDIDSNKTLNLHAHLDAAIELALWLTKYDASQCDIQPTLHIMIRKQQQDAFRVSYLDHLISKY